MDITTRNRTDLKKYFQKGDKPTELQFAEFIEAGLNQADDGIVKPAGDPLSIQVNDKDGVQKLLNFYEDFQDNNPRWALNLNPKEGTENRPGFNIMDGGGNSRLFIQDGTGNVGIGTTIPGDSLEINRNWFDANTDNWGGGIRLKGTAPTISFWESDNGNHRWMWHLSADIMNLYRRPAGGGWENKLNINKDGTLFISAAIISPMGTLRDNNGGWIRTYGDTGWYSQTHDGGWYMTDSTWLRSYRGKSIHTARLLQADGGLHVGGGGAKFKADANGNVFLSGAITSPKGTLRDNNGGWIRTYENTGWFNETYKGGWYMTDANWIRSYNNKDIYVNTKVRADGGFEVSDNGNKFKVTGAGHIGIGTNAPGDSLEINRNWFDNNTNTWGGGIRLKGNAPTISFWETDNGNHRWMWHLNSDAMNLYRRPAGGSWERNLIIDNEGKLGVKVVPSATLDVARGTGSSGTAIFRGTNNTTHFNYSTAENTYIRGGKPGATVNINDISSPGKTYIGSDFHVAGGKRVYGIPIVDFRSKQVSFSNHKGGPKTMYATVTFSQPVLKAQGLLTSWHLRYDNGRELVRLAGVGCYGASISGNSVTVTVHFYLKDNSGSYDDPFYGEAIVTVIAQLKNAI